MYISQENSRSIGFQEWSDAHQIRHFKNEVGVGVGAFAIQYGLIAALIAVAVVTVLSTIGTNL